MARTQAADYQDRRDAMIENAALLFARQGFLGASLTEIAEAANVSKSLIYHYFKSKEEILHEVMASHIRALEVVATEILRKPLPAKDRLRAITRAFLELYTGAASRHKVLLNDLDHLTPEHRLEIVAAQRRLIRAIEGLLVEVQPELKARGISAISTMLFFGMINWTHTWYDVSGRKTPRELADVATDMALAGVFGSRGNRL